MIRKIGTGHLQLNGIGEALRLKAENVATNEKARAVLIVNTSFVYFFCFWLNKNVLIKIFSPANS